VRADGTSGRRIDPLGIVVATVAVGVLVAALHHPRSGMWVASAGLAAGALLRLVLSPRNAGLLVVRKRRMDVVVLAGLAIALGVLAAVTPFPAGSG
jgi:preprotein translocase subunit Sec61beta